MNHSTLDVWTLQGLLRALILRWYLGAAAVVAGALAGMALAALLPAQYEARLPLFVAFNADAQFMTPDDYKNWQMEQLEGFVESGPVLEETLARLQAQDPSWNAAGIETLQAGLAPRWRNAGVWHLTAVSEDPQTATALLEAWHLVVLAHTAEALEHAQAFYTLDIERSLQLRTLADLRQHETELETLETSFRELLTSLEGSEENLTPAQKSAARALAGLLPAGGGTVVIPPPPTGDNAAEYTAWAQQALDVFSAGRDALAAQRGRTQTAIADSSERWLETKRASHGLSAFLLVEPAADSRVQVAPLRASGMWALAGALAGLFGWLLLHFAGALRMNRVSE